MNAVTRTQQGGKLRGHPFRRKRVEPVEIEWKSKGGTLFGWIDNPHSRQETLVLSHHSRVALARENTRRCREDVVKYISQYIN